MSGKKPCDCDQGGPGLAASVRNAAALFTSAGKIAGFVEGSRWACEALDKALASFEQQVPKAKEKARLAELRKYVAGVRAQCEARHPEQAQLAQAATKMVEELERRPPRTVVSRVRSAVRAFKLG